MLKTKICVFAAASVLTLGSISPMSAFATETNQPSAVQSERDEQKERKAAFEEMIRQANDKWNSLTPKQRKGVYQLLEKELKANMKMMDKLAELGVFEQEDINNYKKQMMLGFEKLVEDELFPIMMHKPRKNHD